MQRVKRFIYLDTNHNPRHESSSHGQYYMYMYASVGSMILLPYTYHNRANYNSLTSDIDFVRSTLVNVRSSFADA